MQRYGFHGLSYAYLLGELARLGDPAATTALISPDAGRVRVRVVRTDEQLVMARSFARVLNLDSIRKPDP